MKKNVEARSGTIAGVLNVMEDEARLIRRLKGNQKVLWSRATGGKRESDETTVERHAGLGRSGMGRLFPPPGGKAVPSYG